MSRLRCHETSFNGGQVKFKINKMKKNIYKTINDKVLEGLEKDGLKWFMPWKSGMGNSPINNATKKAYKGINIWLLNIEMRTNGYESNEWVTYKQAIDKGGNVKKGQKSTEVVYWKISFYDKTANPKKFYRSEKDAMSDGVAKENIHKVFTLYNYRVFNIAQCEGLTAIRTNEELETPSEIGNIKVASDYCDNYLKNEEISLTHNATSSAYYQPSTDIINMPVLESFKDVDSYYKTLFHEISHSTGHEKRLKRQGVIKGGKGTDLYAKEELIAEITSLYMSGVCGIMPTDHLDNSQAYLNGWIKRIKNFKGNEEKLIVSAMTQASKSADLIISHSELVEA